tara:strand:+ start:208 stop:1200 length:993 start_codon:yes stop_codon:yes gene_type:complete
MFFESFTLFLINFFITSSLSPILQNIGAKLNLIDRPDYRKINKRSLVRVGGICFIASFIISSLIILFFTKYNLITTDGYKNFFTISIIISIFSFLLGFADDLKSLSPIFRLFMQIIISAFVWICGVQITNIDISFLRLDIEFIQVSKFTSFFLTIIWITGITNAINWIDGLDGLASSLVGVSSLSLGILFIGNGNIQEGLVLIGISGSCLGFLIFNRYPAKLIMGDGGSYFLGFNLGYLSILGSSSYLVSESLNISTQNLHFFILIFVIPLIDMTYVILVRLLKGLSPFYPDNNHIHHRLMNLGLSHDKVVKFLTGANIVICIFSFIILL